MKNEKLSKYKIAFKFLTLLNLVMVVFLFEHVVAQNNSASSQNQATIIARVIPQSDSPLQISIIRVENSAPSFQSVIFSVRNVSNQPIRAFTITGENIITYSFAAKMLFPGEIYESSMEVERNSIKAGTESLLSVDYVEFERGNSWGRDLAGKSKQIREERVGRIYAIRFLKDLLRNGNTSAIANILNQEVSKMSVPRPQINLDSDGEKGFRRGFKGIISILQKNENKSLDSISKKLNELESINQ